MCLSPSRLPDGTLVACRSCRICLDNRVNDLVGRCLAEQAISTAAFSVTLTYAGDTANAVYLAYRDVQLMVKSLRKDGYKVRYLVAGEYGTEKGRAHWHAVLFFQGKVPDVVQDMRVNWKYWPHGFSYWQKPDYGGFRYAMKYALKNLSADAHVRSLAMSKKPPLGYGFFMQMAEDLVDRQLPVLAPEYAFSHVRNKDGTARKYWLQGRMRELFLDRYCELWAERWGGEPPHSDWLLERYYDPKIRAELHDSPEALAAKLEDQRPKRVYLVPDPEPEETASYVGYLSVTDGRNRYMIFASDDCTFAVCKGGEEWIGEISTGAIVGAQLRNIGLSKSAAMLACRWLVKRKIGLVPQAV